MYTILSTLLPNTSIQKTKQIINIKYPDEDYFNFELLYKCRDVSKMKFSRVESTNI